MNMGHRGMLADTSTKVYMIQHRETNKFLRTGGGSTSEKWVTLEQGTHYMSEGIAIRAAKCNRHQGPMKVVSLSVAVLESKEIA